MRVRLVALVSVILAALLGACGDNGHGQPPASDAEGSVAGAGSASALRGDLAVFAAASLTDAFTEVGAEFQKQHPAVSVKFNFGASSALRTQLEQGARADVFASADEIQMDNATKAGVVAGEPSIFVKNKLVVIYPSGNPGRVGSIQDLARPGLKLVLTDRAVPIGAYARTALDKLSADPQYGADFGRRVLANLRSEEANVRAVVTKVQLGEADAGIVYASDVTPAVAKDVTSLLIPDAFNTVATYPIAVVKDAPNAAAARAFIEFVRSARGQEILKQHNFITDRDTGVARLPRPEGGDQQAHAGAFVPLRRLPVMG